MAVKEQPIGTVRFPIAHTTTTGALRWLTDDANALTLVDILENRRLLVIPAWPYSPPPYKKISALKWRADVTSEQDSGGTRRGQQCPETSTHPKWANLAAKNTVFDDTFSENIPLFNVSNFENGMYVDG